MSSLHHIFPWQKKSVFCPVTLRMFRLFHGVLPGNIGARDDGKKEDGLHGLPIKWAVIGIVALGNEELTLTEMWKPEEEQDPAANRNLKFSPENGRLMAVLGGFSHGDSTEYSTEQLKHGLVEREARLAFSPENGNKWSVGCSSETTIRWSYREHASPRRL